MADKEVIQKFSKQKIKIVEVYEPIAFKSGTGSILKFKAEDGRVFATFLSSIQKHITRDTEITADGEQQKDIYMGEEKRSWVISEVYVNDQPVTKSSSPRGGYGKSTEVTKLEGEYRLQDRMLGTSSIESQVAVKEMGELLRLSITFDKDLVTADDKEIYMAALRRGIPSFRADNVKPIIGEAKPETKPPEAPSVIPKGEIPPEDHKWPDRGKMMDYLVLEVKLTMPDILTFCGKGKITEVEPGEWWPQIREELVIPRVNDAIR